MDGADRARKAAVVLRQLVADQRLVEMHVCVDEGRQQQAAVAALGRRHLGDQLAFPAHVSRGPLGQTYPFQTRHRGFTFLLSRTTSRDQQKGDFAWLSLKALANGTSSIPKTGCRGL